MTRKLFFIRTFIYFIILIINMKLICKCGNKWNYKGKKKILATCPDCHSLVKIKGKDDDL